MKKLLILTILAQITFLAAAMQPNQPLEQKPCPIGNIKERLKSGLDSIIEYNNFYKDLSIKDKLEGKEKILSTDTDDFYLDVRLLQEPDLPGLSFQFEGFLIKNSNTSHQFDIVARMIVKLYCHSIYIHEIEVIEHTNRGKGYGTLLIKAMSQRFKEHIKNRTILGHATPFNLQKDKTHEQMFPKLITFYEKLGGVVTEKSSDGKLAEMQYDPTKVKAKL